MLETGAFYTDLHSISTEELAQRINDLPEWDAQLLAELCSRAGIIDEWNDAEPEEAENIAYKAAEILGIEI